MKLTIADTRLFKDSINVISELVSEAQFRVDKDKIELIAMDPANVVMVIFKLLSSAFIEYNVKEDKVIGVNLDAMKQILRRVKQADTLSLELDEERNRLKISLKGETNRTFNLGLIDIEERERKIPELKFTAKVETNSDILGNAIEDVGIISDSVAFEASPEKLVIKGEGNVSDVRVEINNSEETSISNKGENIKARYSVEYLKKLIQGSKLSDNVVIEYSKDYPLKLEYKVLNKLGLQFILAPRVAND